MTGVRICYEGGHMFTARQLLCSLEYHFRFCLFALVLYKIMQWVQYVLT